MKGVTMTAPLVHIFSVAVKDGQVDGFRQYAQEHVEFAEAAHPRLLAFHHYLSEDGRTTFTVQVHPDSDSLAYFMSNVVAEHGIKAYEFVEQGTERSDIYGPLDDSLRDRIQQYGVTLSLNPHHLGGFTRLSAGK